MRTLTWAALVKITCTNRRFSRQVDYLPIARFIRTQLFAMDLKVRPLTQPGRHKLVKYPQWPRQQSPVVLYTKCRRIYGEPLLPTRRREQHGRTLRRSHATNGSAGLFPSRNLKPESSTSREHAQSLKKECVGPVAGPVACIVEISASASRKLSPRRRNRPSRPTRRHIRPKSEQLQTRQAIPRQSQ